MRQLETKVEQLQRTAEALAQREETTRVSSGDVAGRLHAAESALQEAQVETDALRSAVKRSPKLAPGL